MAINVTVFIFYDNYRRNTSGWKLTANLLEHKQYTENNVLQMLFSVSHPNEKQQT